MGVNGLWHLVQPAGRPITFDDLADKVVAVDISSWVYQYMKAMRDQDGEVIKNAHLLGLFRRLCILLYHGVKPIIVFDGAAPALKLRTLSKRKQFRDRSQETFRKTAERLFQSQMRIHALSTLAGKEVDVDSLYKKPNRTEDDMFIAAEGATGDGSVVIPEQSAEEIARENALARAKEQQTTHSDSESEDDNGNITHGTSNPQTHSHWQPADSVQSATAANAPSHTEHQGDDDTDAYTQREQFLSKFLEVDVTKFDVTSEQFLALPADIQHEILLEVQERQKHWTRFNKEKASHEMSKDSTSYSDMQIQRLLKKNDISRQLDDVRARLQYVNDESGVGSKRVAGDVDTEFVLQYFKEEGADEEEVKQIAAPPKVPRIGNTETPPPGSVPVTVQVHSKVLDGVATDGESDDDDLFPASMFDTSHPSNFTMDDPEFADDHDGQEPETAELTTITNTATEDDEAAQLQMAIAMSLGQPVEATAKANQATHSQAQTAHQQLSAPAKPSVIRGGPPSSPANDTDDELQRALALSLQQAQPTTSGLSVLKRQDSAEQLRQALALSREEMNKPKINRDPILTNTHVLVKTPSGKGKAKLDESITFPSITVSQSKSANGEGSSRGLTSSPFAVQSTSTASAKQGAPVVVSESSSGSTAYGSSSTALSSTAPGRNAVGDASKHLTSSPFAIPFPIRAASPSIPTPDKGGGNSSHNNSNSTTAATAHVTITSGVGTSSESAAATKGDIDNDPGKSVEIFNGTGAKNDITQATSNGVYNNEEVPNPTIADTAANARLSDSLARSGQSDEQHGKTQMKTGVEDRCAQQMKDKHGEAQMESDAYGDTEDDSDGEGDLQQTEQSAFGYLLDAGANADDDALLNEQFGFFVDSDDDTNGAKEDHTGDSDRHNHAHEDSAGVEKMAQRGEGSEETQSEGLNKSTTTAAPENTAAKTSGDAAPTHDLQTEQSDIDYTHTTDDHNNTHQHVTAQATQARAGNDPETLNASLPQFVVIPGSPNKSAPPHKGMADTATATAPAHTTTQPKYGRSLDTSLSSKDTVANGSQSTTEKHTRSQEQRPTGDAMDTDPAKSADSSANGYTDRIHQLQQPRERVLIDVDNADTDSGKEMGARGLLSAGSSHGPRGRAIDADPFTDLDSMFGATTDDDAMRNDDLRSGTQSEVEGDGLFAEDSDDDAVDGIIGMINMDDIEGIQGQLRQEWKNIRKEKRTAKRDASQVTEDIYSDSKALLRLFGVPWIDSPSEAEAQCAELDRLGLCAGSITEDSDIFLFGARTVYKNMFSLSNTAELYQISDIERMLNLTRADLINVALCSGSDYTEGIRGVGPVTSIEIISEFSNYDTGDDAVDDEEGTTQIGMTRPEVDPLVQFRDWYELNRLVPVHKDEAETAFRRKLRMAKVPLMLPRGFPDPEVRKAYTQPEVDTSTESFEFGDPDIDQLREYASAMFNWDYERTDEMLLPVVRRRMNPDKQQRRQPTLNAYFAPQAQSANRDIESKRVKTAISLQRRKKVLEATKKRNKKIRKKQMEYRPKKRKQAPNESHGNTSASKSKAAKVGDKKSNA